MSAPRRQTRASGTFNTKTTMHVQPISVDNISASKTRSGQSRSNLPSQQKASKLNKGSPSMKNFPAATCLSPSRKNIIKPSSPKRRVQKLEDKSSSTSPVGVRNSVLKAAAKSSENVKKKANFSPHASVTLRASPRNAIPKTPTTPSAQKSMPKLQRNLKSPNSLKKEVETSPLKHENSKVSSPSKLTPKSSPSTPSRSSRKRLLSSPTHLPQSPKSRRLRGNALSPVQVKVEHDSEDESLVLAQVKCDLEKTELLGEAGQGDPSSKDAGIALPSDPELSDRFLRRKWFSLKARGGFTCLRSAILSPEEIAQEVMQHTTVDTPHEEDSNFFTTKLMVRLSSRLPPARARPSCEELVDLIKSKQSGPNFVPQAEQKGESTAIRVKLERRSFSDTMSHINSKPVRASGKPVRSSNPAPKPQTVTQKADAKLSKKQERDIALRQLKNLSVLEEENPHSSNTQAALTKDINDRLNGRRWFSLKSRGSHTCLRSAILSPEELTEEFMKRTKVTPPATSLMIKPVVQEFTRVGRARLSSEDLVGIINAKQVRKNFESLVDKGEETGVKGINIIKERDQEIALQQLNVLRYW